MAATAVVLMFIESHVEMESATWLKHLLVPIVQNPRTMALQTLDIISDLDHSYGEGGGDLLYGIITDFSSSATTRRGSPARLRRSPESACHTRHLFGPGSLFVIRRSEYTKVNLEPNC
jgi:hypothetical protein